MAAKLFLITGTKESFFLLHITICMIE